VEKIIQALAETNIPTIITVSGIALLFLALAGRFGTYIEIKAERQNAAAAVGGILLLIGVAIYAYPLISEEKAQASVAPSSVTPAETGPVVVPPASPQLRWIMAGSFSSKVAATLRHNALAAAEIDAITVESDHYDFLCPGFFTVMVLAPNRDAMRTLLADVREVEPTAYPRNPATFNRNTC
jgi:hypothetical protein